MWLAVNPIFIILEVCQIHKPHSKNKKIVKFVAFILRKDMNQL